MPQWLYTVFDIQDVLYKIAAAAVFILCIRAFIVREKRTLIQFYLALAVAAFIFFFPFVLVAITAVFDGFFKGI